MFVRPNGHRLVLAVQPRLASWDAAGHPDQIRLDLFLRHVERLALPVLLNLDDPIALCLDVGLPDTVDLLNQHDLDNYAYPLASHLAKTSNRQISTVWCTKRHAQSSFLSISTAETLPERASGGSQWAVVRTTASASTTAFKEQISSQLEGQAVELDEGPVTLELAFTVGPRRNWMNLWKPTIDSLDYLLGRTYDTRRWHPRDGRIVDLGLHCAVEADMGNDIQIALQAANHHGSD